LIDLTSWWWKLGRAATNE